MAALEGDSYQGTIKNGWLDKSVSDPEQTDLTTEHLVVGCRTGSELACLLSDDVAVFLARSAVLSFFIPLIRMNLLSPFDVTQTSKIYYAAVIFV